MRFSATRLVNQRVVEAVNERIGRSPTVEETSTEPRVHMRKTYTKWMALYMGARPH